MVATRRTGEAIGDFDFRRVIGGRGAVIARAVVVRGIGVVVDGTGIGTSSHLVLVADAVGIGVDAGRLIGGNDAEVVDVELLAGHRQLLDVARDDDLAGNEADVSVVGHEDIGATECRSAHVVDVVDEGLAIDAQVFNSAGFEELELDLLHVANASQIVHSRDVVEPQHLSVTGFRLGVHDVGGAEVGRPIDVDHVLEGEVDSFLGSDGRARARDGDRTEGHQLMGELHVAAVHLGGVIAALHRHILAVGVGAVRVVEVRDGHTDQLSGLCDGVGEDVACRHRNAIERPIEVARCTDVVEFGHAVANVHRGKGGVGKAGHVNRTDGDADARDFHHQHGDGLQDEDAEVDGQRGEAGPGEEELSSAEVLDTARHGAILVGEADAERVDLVLPEAEVDGQQGLTAVGIEAGELDVDPVEEGGVAHRGDVRH